MGLSPLTNWLIQLTTTVMYDQLLLSPCHALCRHFKVPRCISASKQKNDKELLLNKRRCYGNGSQTLMNVKERHSVNAGCWIVLLSGIISNDAVLVTRILLGFFFYRSKDSKLLFMVNILRVRYIAFWWISLLRFLMKGRATLSCPRGTSMLLWDKNHLFKALPKIIITFLPDQTWVCNSMLYQHNLVTLLYISFIRRRIGVSLPRKDGCPHYIGLKIECGILKPASVKKNKQTHSSGIYNTRGWFVISSPSHL